MTIPHDTWNATLQVQANSLTLEHAPWPGVVLAGNPTTATLELTQHGNTSIGIWEASVGGTQDIEVDEVFIVIAGKARVEFMETGRVLHLEPGIIARLHAGERTAWHVEETLRKVYVI